MEKTTVNFQDIRFVYKDKPRVLRLSEHLQMVSPEEIIKELSRYRFYEDYFVYLYQAQKFDLKRIYIGLDMEKRGNMMQAQEASRDSKGKPTFKYTEAMVEGEVTISPLYVQSKRNLNETLFSLNRIRSAINLLEWKLCFLSNNAKRPGKRVDEEQVPGTWMQNAFGKNE